MPAFDIGHAVTMSLCPHFVSSIRPLPASTCSNAGLAVTWDARVLVKLMWPRSTISFTGAARDWSICVADSHTNRISTKTWRC